MLESWGFKDWKSCAPGDVATISCIPILFLNIINALLLFAGLAALAIFIIGGFKFIESGGDSKKLEGARNTLTNGILGLAIIASSFLIINLISGFTGVKCIVNISIFGCQ